MGIVIKATNANSFRDSIRYSSTLANYVCIKHPRSFRDVTSYYAIRWAGRQHCSRWRVYSWKLKWRWWLRFWFWFGQHLQWWRLKNWFGPNYDCYGKNLWRKDWHKIWKVRRRHLWRRQSLHCLPRCLERQKAFTVYVCSACTGSI